MRRYFAAYALWLLGVLSAAAVAFYYYKRVLAMGDEALARELHTDARPPVPPSPLLPEAEPPGFEDAVPIEEARPPGFEAIRRRSGGAT